MELPDFIGKAVRIDELQINQNYAMIFTQDDPEDEEIRYLRFHSMSSVPSQRVLESTVVTFRERNQTIAFVTLLYWDEHVWQCRSLLNENILTIDRKTFELIDDNLSS